MGRRAWTNTGDLLDSLVGIGCRYGRLPGSLRRWASRKRFACWSATISAPPALPSHHRLQDEGHQRLDARAFRLAVEHNSATTNPGNTRSSNPALLFPTEQSFQGADRLDSAGMPRPSDHPRRSPPAPPIQPVLPDCTPPPCYPVACRTAFRLVPTPKGFEVRSFSKALASIASANSAFSLRFPLSTVLNRRVFAAVMPPNLAL